MRNSTIDHACTLSRKLDEHLQRLMANHKLLNVGDIDDLREWVDSIRIESYHAGLDDGRKGKVAA